MAGSNQRTPTVHTATINDIHPMETHTPYAIARSQGAHFDKKTVDEWMEALKHIPVYSLRGVEPCQVCLELGRNGIHDVPCSVCDE